MKSTAQTTFRKNVRKKIGVIAWTSVAALSSITLTADFAVGQLSSDAREISTNSDSVTKGNASEERFASQSAEEISVVASDRQDALNTLYQNQWVQLDSRGSFTGRIVVNEGLQALGVSGIEVTISRNGQIVTTANTNSAGEFQCVGIEPGYYAITTEATNALSCLGLTVLGPGLGQHLPNSIEVRAVSGNSQRFQELMTMFPAVTTPDEGDLVEVSADPIGLDRQFADTHMIRLSSDGSIVGRVSRSARVYSSDDLSDLSIYILRDGNQVDSVQANRDGAFKVLNMTQGCYAFVAVGPRDIGVCSFCAVNENLVSNQVKSSRLVSMQLPSVSQLNVEVVDRATLPTNVIVEEVIVEEVVSEGVVGAPTGGFAPVGGGGFGGGGIFGGGGGGGFGGGGFGGVGTGLLGAAGLAGVIFAISEADDDDNVIFTPPPVVSAVAP